MNHNLNHYILIVINQQKKSVVCWIAWKTQLETTLCGDSEEIKHIYEQIKNLCEINLRCFELLFLLKVATNTDIKVLKDFINLTMTPMLQRSYRVKIRGNIADKRQTHLLQEKYIFFWSVVFCGCQSVYVNSLLIIVFLYSR